MLYFSEASWSLPDIFEVNEVFDREYDQAKYEQKIGKLVGKARANARAHDPEGLKPWNEAVRVLRREDHYLLVLIDAANPLGLSAGRLLTLLAIALIIAGIVVLYRFALVR